MDASPHLPSRSRVARAYWCVGPGRGELRRTELPGPGPDECLVRTLVSGVSEQQLAKRALTQVQAPVAV